MKKMLRFLLLNLFLIDIIKCNQLITVQAEFDQVSNILIYNGNVYKLTENNSILKPYIENNKNPISLHEEKEGKEKGFFDGFWFNFIGFSILSCFAGAMSGLTVGYLSIDMLILEIKLISGTQQEKIYANKIKKIISDHHWILVTLLLCNAFACEAMPILLDKLVTDIVAIIISVTVLLFVGEIVPQALCTGPNQMKIAAFLSPFTYALMIITYPLSYPIARFMDLVIGVHGKTRFCNSDLKSVIELHVKEFTNFEASQMGYFTGFLDIIHKRVGEIMRPIDQIYKLDSKYKINKASVENLVGCGFSRIPIYEGETNNFIGILRVKDLVGKDTLIQKDLDESGIQLTDAIHTTENTFFLDLFEQFKEGKSKMAFVHKDVQGEILLSNNELESEKEKAINNSVDIKEPLINDKSINSDGKEDFQKSPIVGIVTMEDLIEFWFKIHISNKEDYEKTGKGKRRRLTL